MSSPAPAPFDEAARRRHLIAAEDRALDLLDRIAALGLIAPGRTERAVERDIQALAAAEFGVTRHWHKRIVRAGANTLATASDNPPVRVIGDDDIVFLDLGPVVGAWEADVGYSHALGADPVRHALCAALPRQFEAVAAHFRADPDISGADLYAFACASAAAAGWRFGGRIAGHVVAEFPHAHLPGGKAANRIAPDNPGRLRDPDGNGRRRHWILEIHLIDPSGTFGGFYERLIRDDAEQPASPRTPLSAVRSAPSGSGHWPPD